MTIYFYSKDTDNKKSLLTSLDINNINYIKIHKSDAGDIIFIKKDNNNWYMQSPYKIHAHQFRLNSLLGLTQIPVNKSYEIDELILADYALDKPRAHITFNNTDVFFGKINSLNNKRYLLAENKMVLINDQTYPLVSAHASSFVNLSLLNEDFIITKIETPETSLHLDKDGLWHSSGNNRLNADQIQSFLEHWKLARAFAVHELVNKKSLGEITISTDSKTITFNITSTDPWLILSLPELNIEYHLDKSMKNILLGVIKPDLPDA
ncbi:MAG: DUF4340 domain-containing protein [Gammaproteobacteria bacterium]|nr:DUF4340 domain-containing protein [Gammaproteobacteria bacterium]